MGGSPGKLKAAAQWLFSDDSTSSAATHRERAEALRRLGVPQAQIDQAQPPPSPDPADTLQLWAWHETALDLLAAMRTQWRVLPGPWGLYREGLDYSALPVVAAALGVTTTRDVLQQLQELEREAARILNNADSSE
ncbi:MAG: hypothetical protein RL375_139 [Pseudomonadota bacterium]